jgi:hypothetical protein
MNEVETIDELFRLIEEFDRKETVHNDEVVNFVDRKAMLKHALFIKWLTVKTKRDVLSLIGSFKTLDRAIFEVAEFHSDYFRSDEMFELVGFPSKDWRPIDLVTFNKVVKGELSPLAYAKLVKENPRHFQTNKMSLGEFLLVNPIPSDLLDYLIDYGLTETARTALSLQTVAWDDSVPSQEVVVNRMRPKHTKGSIEVHYIRRFNGMMVQLNEKFKETILNCDDLTKSSRLSSEIVKLRGLFKPVNSISDAKTLIDDHRVNVLFDWIKLDPSIDGFHEMFTVKELMKRGFWDDLSEIVNLDPIEMFHLVKKGDEVTKFKLSIALSAYFYVDIKV